MTKPADNFILICTGCNGRAAAGRVRAALAADLPPGFAIRAVDCMAGCDRPATVGFQAAGKASYLFGDIETAADLEALSSFARQYRASQSGWTSAADRPAALYTKTLARLPGFAAAEDA